MKVMAVIIRQDRTNDKIIVPKRQIMGKTFRIDDETYFLHQDRFQVTWDRPNWTLGLRRRYFATYYYAKGHPQPIPLQELAKFFDLTKAENDGKKGAQAKVIDNGISGEELAAIFNPWFYRVIAAQTMSLWEQIQLWASIGACAGIAYLIYALATGNYELPQAPPNPTGAP